MNFKYRWIIIIVVLGLSLYSMFPLSKNVRLGLDLQGGMHVVLGVDTDAAVSSKIDALLFQMKRQLQSEKIPFSYIQKSSPYELSITAESNDDIKRIREIARQYNLEQKEHKNLKVSYGLSSAEEDVVRNNAVLQSLEIIRNRIDEFGVSEPLIQRKGTNQILVQLPGLTDHQRATNLIGQTAQLNFYLVDSTATNSATIPFGSIALNSKPDSNGQVVTYILKRDPVMSGDTITDAYVSFDQYNRPQIQFTLDALGTKIFSDITAKNIGSGLAIVMDDTVYSAPVIQTKIDKGTGSITGQFTMAEAQDLAIALRAGSLPAPIKIEENRTVGPSLGLDSIKSGVTASIIGLALISAFMLIYYRLSGLVAVIGLICNATVLVGALCTLGATLTMPGIAGIILTLGIAVDANVLIFERVREELRNGRTALNALEIGYQKAFATIVDANVTSLIASLVLFQFGTGPVKGFAVTLSIGLIASMFTAVFVTKTVFMSLIVRENSKKISI